MSLAIDYGTPGRDNSHGPFLIPDMKDRLIDWLNTALMINLFFVLASFVWFVTALAGQAAKVNLGFDLWYSLWDPLFMPSIGILMAAPLSAASLAGCRVVFLLDNLSD